jgi:tetratricopeptide (TPR) repeat protein
MLDRAIALKKGDPSLLVTKGFIDIGLERIDEARDSFTKALVAWPNDVNARFGLAELELLAGRITSASAYYEEALRRNPENRKALLSLAILSRESGKYALAREYISKALLYHGDNPQVFYYAGYLASLDGSQAEAERFARAALALKPDYELANELLTAVYFRSGRYAEVVSLCDRRIAVDRNRPSAWYLKALALGKQGNTKDFLSAARTGLEVASDDELFRAMAELYISDRLSFEDSKRAPWAFYHANKARLFAQKNLSEQALHEYRRALKINPDDFQSRLEYANVRLTRGYPGRYLSQLRFIQSRGKGTKPVNDAVESYARLLAPSVQGYWGIDPLLLDKAHVRIGVYHIPDPANVAHPDGERITADMLADTFSHDMRFSVRSHPTPVASYSEAFRASRSAGEDYFAMVRLREGKRDVMITSELYVSATGSKAETFTCFRTGNDRYASALRRLAVMMAQALPKHGAIVSRRQADCLIDLGKSDGIEVGQAFHVVEKGKARFLGEGLGIAYAETDVVATFTVTAIDEDVSQGLLERNGFFDRVKAGDIVIPQKGEASEGKDPKAKPQVTDPAGKIPPLVFSIVRKISR